MTFTDDNEVVIVILDETTKRVHKLVKQAGDIVYVDGTGTLDRTDTQLFKLMTCSPAGESAPDFSFSFYVSLKFPSTFYISFSYKVSFSFLSCFLLFLFLLFSFSLYFFSSFFVLLLLVPPSSLSHFTFPFFYSFSFSPRCSCCCSFSYSCSCSVWPVLVKQTVDWPDPAPVVASGPQTGPQQP